MAPNRIQRPTYHCAAVQTEPETPTRAPETPLELAARLFLESGGYLIPEDLQCPCSHELMLKPVFLAESGQTYDESSLLAFFALGQYIDPYTRQELHSHTLVPNWNAQRKLDAFQNAVLALDPSATRYFERPTPAVPEQPVAQSEDGFESASPLSAANRLRSPSLLPLLGSRSGSRSPSPFSRRSSSRSVSPSRPPPPAPAGFNRAELRGMPAREFEALGLVLDAAEMDEPQRDAIAECLLWTYVAGRPEAAPRLNSIFCDAMKQVWRNNAEQLATDVANTTGLNGDALESARDDMLRAVRHCVEQEGPDNVEDLDLHMQRTLRQLQGRSLLSDEIDIDWNNLLQAMAQIVYPLTVAYGAADNAVQRLSAAL